MMIFFYSTNTILTSTKLLPGHVCRYSTHVPESYGSQEWDIHYGECSEVCKLSGACSQV